VKVKNSRHSIKSKALRADKMLSPAFSALALLGPPNVFSAIVVEKANRKTGSQSF